MEFPIEVNLRRPVTHDGTTIDRLVFDEPDLGLSIAVEEAGAATEQTLVLLAGMAGVERGVLLKIKEGDFREICKRVLHPYQAQFAAKPGDDAGNEIAPPS